MNYTLAMASLSALYALGEAGNSVTLSSLELASINEGISALKTLEDMKCHSASTYGQIVSRETLRAKWEQIDNESDTFFTMHQYKCSNCGKIQIAKSKNIKNFRYCSKCGADMRSDVLKLIDKHIESENNEND